MKGSIRQKPWIYGSMDMELTKLTIYLNVWMKALKMMKIYKLVDLKVMILLVEKCKGLEHIWSERTGLGFAHMKFKVIAGRPYRNGCLEPGENSACRLWKE